VSSSSHIIRVIKSRRMRLVSHVARKGDEKYSLVANPEGKRPLWKPRHRWKENTEMFLKGTGCEVNAPKL
jgi:hypothetical protein